MSDEITGYPDHYIVNGDSSTCPCPEHLNLAAQWGAVAGDARANVVAAFDFFALSPEAGVAFSELLNTYRAECRRDLLLVIEEAHAALDEAFRADPIVMGPKMPALREPLDRVWSATELKMMGEQG